MQALVQMINDMPQAQQAITRLGVVGGKEKQFTNPKARSGQLICLDCLDNRVTA
jgi:hypothetical protein